MSALRLDVQWEEADEVSSRELSATWARFGLYVGDESLSVVEDAFAESYRSSIDVSVYPLAEWMAFNWWFLTTANAGRVRSGQFSDALDRQRYCMASAGDGFPWPPLFLLPEDHCFLASQTPSRSTLNRVNFVRSGRYVLDFDSTVYALERFVDSVVRRLEDRGVKESRLQDEWAAIQAAPADEVDFCRAAAVLGYNPYSLDEAVAEALINAGEAVSDGALFLDMLSAVDFLELSDSVDWLNASLEALHSGRPVLTSDDLLRVTKDVGESGVPVEPITAQRPWQAGYDRARMVRDTLGVDEAERLDLDALVAVEQVESFSPGSLEALIQAERSTAFAVISKQRSQDSARFTQARTLSRAIFDDRTGPQIMSHGSSLRDRAERAFAAELLAPSQGLAAFLATDLSEGAVSRAASHFGVGRLVIEHQIENQLDWALRRL